jgi:membrane protein
MIEKKLPDRPTADEGPKSPSGLPRRSWWRALRRAVVQADEDKVTTWAGALTYYGILSIFPGLLVLISVLRLAGDGVMRAILKNLTATAPGPTRSVVTAAITNLEQGQQSTAGLLAVIGVLVALWSSSSYIGSFMDAANAIFDVPEGRPIWKRLPIRLAITVVAGIIVLAASVTVVVTGGLARQLGSLIGAEGGTVAVWDVAKWPVLVVVVGILFAILYWAAPNAKQGGFRWVTPGSALATLMWVAASAGFAFYVARFNSYNKTYGSLAAIIVFLVWLWISNLALLLGAEFDAELQRERAAAAGHPREDEPYLRLRDTGGVTGDDGTGDEPPPVPHTRQQPS